MKCQFFKNAIICGDRPIRKACCVDGCRQHAIALCDYQIQGGDKTCDMPMCHAHRVIKERLEDDSVDYCPYHEQFDRWQDAPPRTSLEVRHG